MRCLKHKPKTEIYYTVKIPAIDITFKAESKEDAMKKARKELKFFLNKILLKNENWKEKS